jgi:hypothetical protein
VIWLFTDHTPLQVMHRFALRMLLSLFYTVAFGMPHFTQLCVCLFVLLLLFVCSLAFVCRTSLNCVGVSLFYTVAFGMPHFTQLWRLVCRTSLNTPTHTVAFGMPHFTQLCGWLILFVCSLAFVCLFSCFCLFVLLLLFVWYAALHSTVWVVDFVCLFSCFCLFVLVVPLALQVRARIQANRSVPWAKNLCQNKCASAVLRAWEPRVFLSVHRPRQRVERGKTNAQRSAQLGQMCGQTRRIGCG